MTNRPYVSKLAGHAESELRPLATTIGELWAAEDRGLGALRAKDVRQRFYAISVERKIKNPAVVAICEAARKNILA
jgi:LysR family transcriptional activator of nhaA